LAELEIDTEAQHPPMPQPSRDGCQDHITPAAAAQKYAVAHEQSNGRNVKSAENFSWFGMSSAVRRLTQGASAPSPHTPVIKCTSGHHDHFAYFPSTHSPAGAPDLDGGCLACFLAPDNGFIRGCGPNPTFHAT
jgi:hypothetical protein